MNRLLPLVAAAATLVPWSFVGGDEAPARQRFSVAELNASKRIVCVWKKGTAKEALRAIDQAGLHVVYTGKALPLGTCTGRLTEDGLRALLSSPILSVEPDIDLRVDFQDRPQAEAEPQIKQVDGELLNAYEHAGRLVCVWNPGKKKAALDAIKKIAQLRVVYAPEKLPFAVCDWRPPLQAETLRKLMGASELKSVEPDLQLIADRAEQGRVIEFPTGTPRVIVDADGRTETFPEDTSIDKLWGMKNTCAPLAWTGATTTDVLVSVIDSGVDYEHSDLKANVWVNRAERPGNKMDDDGNGQIDDFYGLNFTTLPPTADTMDRFGHGSHVTGILGAVGNNKCGVAGMSWRVQCMGLKVFDDNATAPVATALAAAIDYALGRGAKIINLSLRWNGERDFLKLAIDGAEKAGVLIVCAAGNLYPGEQPKTRDNDAVPHYPASFSNENIIAVANITERDELNPTSHYGLRSVDLGAPGTDVYSTVPTAVKPIGYDSYTGTSMAAPHVAGAAALVWGQPRFRSLDYKSIRKLLLDNTRAIPSLSGKCATGGTLDLSFLYTKSQPQHPTGGRSAPSLVGPRYFVASPPRNHAFYRFRCRGYEARQ